MSLVTYQPDGSLMHGGQRVLVSAHMYMYVGHSGRVKHAEIRKRNYLWMHTCSHKISIFPMPSSQLSEIVHFTKFQAMVEFGSSGQGRARKVM